MDLIIAFLRISIIEKDGLTDGLNDTKLTAETEYFNNIAEQQNKTK